MNDVAVFQPARLPHHPAIAERYGIDKSGWKALVEAIFPLAKTTDSVVMALSYCKARNLDPFKRPVHIVPMWDSKSGGYVETVWPGIAELRTTAFRTGQYGGCDEATFGPEVTKTFTGKVKTKAGYEQKETTVTFPEWCRITVYRIKGGQHLRFVGPKVKWMESYATIGASDLPNDMWASRPEGQLEKCAEAAALRKAFPEEIGNELTAEEMAGRSINGTIAREQPQAAEIIPLSQRLANAPRMIDQQITNHIDRETGEVTSQTEPEDSAAPQEQDKQPPSAPAAAPAETTAAGEQSDDPEQRAYDAGAAARRAGQKRQVPDYFVDPDKPNLADNWENGWDDVDAEERG